MAKHYPNEDQSLIKKYDHLGIEVKVFEHNIMSFDNMYTKVCIKPNTDSVGPFNITTTINSVSGTAEEDVVSLVGRSIDIYYMEMRKTRRMKTSDEIDDFWKELTHTQKKEYISKRDSAIRELHSIHTRILDILRRDHRDPKLEISMYRFYVKHIQFGKRDEVIVDIAKKFNITSNKVKTITSWYNKNFCFIVVNDSLNRCCLHNRSNVSSVNDHKEDILKSIRIYELNFK